MSRDRAKPDHGPTSPEPNRTDSGASPPEASAGQAACEEQLMRAAAEIAALQARSTAQMRECQRMSATIAQHERAARQLEGALHQRRADEHLGLMELLEEREREVASLRAALKNHELEYRRLTRLLAERAREIYELQSAIGRHIRSEQT